MPSASSALQCRGCVGAFSRGVCLEFGCSRIDTYQSSCLCEIFTTSDFRRVVLLFTRARGGTASSPDSDYSEDLRFT